MDSRPRNNIVGLVLVSVIFIAGLLNFWIDHARGQTATGTNLATVSQLAPSITAVTVNGGSAITPIGNSVATATVSFTVTGGQGCGNVFFGSGTVTTTLFRSGISSTCLAAAPTPNALNCYIVATTTNDCTSATSTSDGHATTTFQIWYFAQSTGNPSSSFPSDNWLASVYLTNGSGTTSTANSASGVNMNMTTAISVGTSSFSYGTVAGGQNTSSTDQISSIKNAGNTSTTLKVSGTAMASGGNTMPTSSQHYATNTFTYNSSDTALSDVGTAVGGWLVNAAPFGNTWATTTPLPSTLSLEPAFISGNYVYTFGGGYTTTSTPTTTVFYAPVNSSGSIGAWSTTTPLQIPLNQQPAFIYNNFAYIFGGNSSGSATSTVFYASVNSTGSISSWSTTTPLPSPIFQHSAFIYNGYAYTFGGNTGSNPTTTVFYAPVGSTGSVGTWATTTPLPSAIDQQPTFISNGYAYSFGGYNGSNGTSTVLYASVNSTGSIGAWTVTTPMPSGTYSFPAFMSNGLAYTFGGYATTSVFYAPVNSSGSIDVWAAVNPFPTATYSNAAFISNGYAYSFGGRSPGGPITSTVLYAPIPSDNLFWGLGVPNGQPAGNYSSTITYTASFSP